jgi:hypothetical protein
MPPAPAGSSGTLTASNKASVDAPVLSGVGDPCDSMGASLAAHAVEVPLACSLASLLAPISPSVFSLLLLPPVLLRFTPPRPSGPTTTTTATPLAPPPPPPSPTSHPPRCFATRVRWRHTMDSRSIAEDRSCRHCSSGWYTASTASTTKSDPHIMIITERHTASPANSWSM